METGPLRIGIFGVGLAAYWPQFSGLKRRLEGYIARVAAQIARPGVEILNLGLVDNSEQARGVGREFRKQDVDLLFLYVTTYAVSSTVLPVVQRAKVPVIVLNLVPTDAIDYRTFNRLDDRALMTSEWLAHCSCCPVPEIANVFRRAGIPFHEVTGMLENDPISKHEIDGWIDAAKVAVGMANNRLGLLGHNYGGMLDVETDATLQSITFGTHLEYIEVDQLSALRRTVKSADIIRREAEFHDVFEVDTECWAKDLFEAARTSVALDQLVAEHRLGSLAYYYKGTGVAENETTLSSIILGTSLLTARGVPVAGEYEVKNAQAMKILDLLGAGGSFSEYYAMDFKNDVVLMGHDGPGHIAIAQGKTRVRPLKVFHGKVGRGVSVEMSLRHGPVTLLSVIESTGGKLALLCAEAKSVRGQNLEIGNTNSRYRFPCGAREFVNRWNSHGPAHHCAIGIGHVADRIIKLGELLGLEAIKVC